MQNLKNKKLLKTKSFKRSLLITKYKLLITPLALALSGCMGIYEGGFECPSGHGVGCKSISEVNQMVNDGDLPEKMGSDLSPSQPPCEQCGANRDHSLDAQHPSKSEIWYPTLVLEEA